jgi:hypothetical protein
MDEQRFNKLVHQNNALMHEHMTEEIINAWTEEELRKAGFDGWPPRQEDIPEEVNFRVRQRMNKYVSERAPEPLRSVLRAAYRANEEAGEILLPENEE